jgi:hypothetical protein
MPFQIVLPNHPLANETTLVRVWRCSDIQVAFEYQSGLVVYLEQNSLDDPAAVWARLAQEYPEYSTGTVSGTPASFAQPDASGGSVGGVQFVRDGVDIVVNGNGEIPLSDLIQVSESLSPVVPSPLVTPTLSISTSAN